MADPTGLYDYRQVGSAQSRQLFQRAYYDRRPLLQDLPVPVDELYRLVAFVLRAKDENPGLTWEEFSDLGSMHAEFLTEVQKCNEAGYSRVLDDGRASDIQDGFVLVSVLRGFAKAKKDIDAVLAAQRKSREEADRVGLLPPSFGVANLPGATRTATGPLQVRKRTPPNRQLFPKLVQTAAPLRPRSPLPPAGQRMSPPGPPQRSRSSSRTPSPPPPFGGGSTDALSQLSVGQESSLTRLLGLVGQYDSRSDLWTVDVDDLRKLFPKHLRVREPSVVVAEMNFDQTLVMTPSVEPTVEIQP